jgi:ABC-2 type transport system ATP-binding protein
MQRMASNAVEMRGVTKTYGATRALDGIDLSIPPGVIYGLLGPNGAGKTTTIRILATLAPADTGSATIFGHDVVRDTVAVRRRISLTGQQASVDEDLSGRENLTLFARLLGFNRSAASARASGLLDGFGLADAADRLVKTYSGGMRRRLDIAASTIVRPDLLFLDEPTTGLDPRSRNQVWGIARALVAAGTTILLTTQYLEEADQLADRVAVIDHGRVIAEGTPGELKSSIGAGALEVRLVDPERRAEAARILTERLGVAMRIAPEPASLAGRIGDPDAVAGALAELSLRGIGVSSYALGQPSLDEVFLALTGKPAGEPESTEEDAA